LLCAQNDRKKTDNKKVKLHHNGAVRTV